MHALRQSRSHRRRVTLQSHHSAAAVTADDDDDSEEAMPLMRFPSLKIDCVDARLDGAGFEDYAIRSALRSEAEQQQPLGWLAKRNLPANTYLFRISGSIEHGSCRALTDIDLTLHANT